MTCRFGMKSCVRLAHGCHARFIQQDIGSTRCGVSRWGPSSGAVLHWLPVDGDHRLRFMISAIFSTAAAHSAEPAGPT